MDYGSNTYLIVKAIHIIFMVSYFAGVFYHIRLFVYFKEAEKQEGTTILQKQFRVMIQRLWNIIIVPASIIMLLTGLILLTSGNFHLFYESWMHIKLTLLLFLLGFHIWMWRTTKSIVQTARVEKTPLQLRKYNEIPTLLLFAIVFVVLLKDHFFEVWLKLIIGFIVLIILIFGIIKIVNRKKDK